MDDNLFLLLIALTVICGAFALMGWLADILGRNFPDAD